MFNRLWSKEPKEPKEPETSNTRYNLWEISSEFNKQEKMNRDKQNDNDARHNTVNMQLLNDVVEKCTLEAKMGKEFYVWNTKNINPKRVEHVLYLLRRDHSFYCESGKNDIRIEWRQLRVNLR